MQWNDESLDWVTTISAIENVGCDAIQSRDRFAKLRAVIHHRGGEHLHAVEPCVRPKPLACESGRARRYSFHHGRGYTRAVARESKC